MTAESLAKIVDEFLAGSRSAVVFEEG